MTSNVEKREQEYVLEAKSVMQTWFSGKPSYHELFRMMLLSTFISAVKQSTAAKLPSELDIQALEQLLARGIHSFMDSFPSLAKDHTTNLHGNLHELIVVLDAAEALERKLISPCFGPLISSFRDDQDHAGLPGWEDHWDLRMLLLKYSSNDEPINAEKVRKSSLVKQINKLLLAKDRRDGTGFDRSKILDYVETVIQKKDQNSKVKYIQMLLTTPDNSPDEPCRLLSAYGAVQHLEGKSTYPSNQGFKKY
jgi:hypothetical protein